MKDCHRLYRLKIIIYNFKKKFNNKNYLVKHPHLNYVTKMKIISQSINKKKISKMKLFRKNFQKIKIFNSNNNLNNYSIIISNKSNKYNKYNHNRIII